MRHSFSLSLKLHSSCSSGQSIREGVTNLRFCKGGTRRYRNSGFIRCILFFFRIIFKTYNFNISMQSFTTFSLLLLFSLSLFCRLSYCICLINDNICFGKWFLIRSACNSIYFMCTPFPPFFLLFITCFQVRDNTFNLKLVIILTG